MILAVAWSCKSNPVIIIYSSVYRRGIASRCASGQRISCLVCSLNGSLHRLSKGKPLCLSLSSGTLRRLPDLGSRTEDRLVVNVLAVIQNVFGVFLVGSERVVDNITWMPTWMLLLGCCPGTKEVIHALKRTIRLILLILIFESVLHLNVGEAS